MGLLSGTKILLQSSVLFFLAPLCLLLTGCQGISGNAAAPGTSPTPIPTATPTPTPSAAAISGVLKWKGDLTGKGLYDQETVLTPANVNIAEFGKHGSFATDGIIIGQPL